MNKTTWKCLPWFPEASKVDALPPNLNGSQLYPSCCWPPHSIMAPFWPWSDHIFHIWNWPATFTSLRESLTHTVAFMIIRDLTTYFSHSISCFPSSSPCPLRLLPLTRALGVERMWGQQLQDSSAPKCHLNSPVPGPVYPVVTSPGPVYPVATSPGPVYSVVTSPGPVYTVAMSPGLVYTVATSPGPVYTVAMSPGPVYTGIRCPGLIYTVAMSPGPVYTGVTSPGPTHTVVRLGHRGAKSMLLFCPWRDSFRADEKMGFVFCGWVSSSWHSLPTPSAPLWTDALTSPRKSWPCAHACLYTPHPVISWVLSPGSWGDRLTHSHHCSLTHFGLVFGWAIKAKRVTRAPWGQWHGYTQSRLLHSGNRIPSLLTVEIGHVPQAQHTTSTYRALLNTYLIFKSRLTRYWFDYLQLTLQKQNWQKRFWL